MDRVSPLRFRLTLVFFVIVALVVFASAYFVFRTLRSSVRRDQDLLMVSAINLARMYADLRYPGAWETKEGILYKGNTALSGNSEALHEIARYMPPETHLTFGAGEPPMLLTNFDLPWYLKLPLLRLTSGALPKPPQAMLNDLARPTPGGAFLALRGRDGASVGWIFARENPSFALEPSKDILIFILLFGAMVTGIIVIGLTFILYRFSAPIDRIVEAHGKAVRRNVELANTSRKDPLTELLNRRGFLDAVTTELSAVFEPGRVFVAMIDVDHFKRVNDTYGHDCGDAVLVTLGGILQSGVRKQDYCARWGGEEFLALLVGVEPVQARNSAKRLCSEVSEHPFFCGMTRIPLSITVGLASLDSLQSLARAVERADAAMYEGKRAGRNTVVVAS